MRSLEKKLAGVSASWSSSSFDGRQKLGMAKTYSSEPSLAMAHSRFSDGCIEDKIRQTRQRRPSAFVVDEDSKRTIKFVDI